MEYEQIVNQNNPVVATTNPNNNLTALQGQNAINIPLQITPIVAQPNNNQVQANQVQNIPTPVVTQPQTNNYSNYNFANYKSQYQNNLPQFTPITIDTNNATEYKSQYANAINEMANQILNMRFNYNPNEDDLLKQAAQYTAQNTYESMNARGILNSSLTAERVARVVGELIPTYEKMARDEFESNFSMLMNTAQFIMNLDDTQYTRWENDRQQKWKEQQAEYEKAQDAIKNAWERVDELGYVDNDAAIVLGVKVGTLSKDAREAKEQREWELEEWNRKQEAQQQAEKELLYLKQQLEEEQAEKDFQRDLQLAYAKSNTSTTSSTSSKTNTTNLSTYESIIKNRYADYNEMTRKYIVTDKEALLDYIESENKAGRMSDNDALSLIAEYNLQVGTTSSKKTSTSNNPLVNSAKTLLSIRR